MCGIQKSFLVLHPNIHNTSLMSICFECIKQSLNLDMLFLLRVLMMPLAIGWGMVTINWQLGLACTLDSTRTACMVVFLPVYTPFLCAGVRSL